MQQHERQPIISITGATGMLGRALVDHLAATGYRPRCLVRPHAVADPGLSPRAELVAGDIWNGAALRSLISGSDACIHLAAHVGHGTAADYQSTNVEGTRTLCEAILAQAPGCRLVYCSSIAALRVPRRLPMLATHYARSKLAATALVRAYQASRGLKAAVVYPGLIYGPGEERLIAGLVERLRARRVFLVSGGERDAPLIYLDDLCDLLRLAATRGAAVGQEFVAVKSHPAGVHDFIRRVARRIGSEPPRLVLPKGLLSALAITLELGYYWVGARNLPPLSRRLVDILSIQSPRSSRAANTAIGWDPRVGLDEGLERTLEWLAARGCEAARTGVEPQPA